VVTRLINLDSEADRILSSVAGEYEGDAGRAVSELLLAHESIELFLDEFETANAAELIRQRDGAARDFERGLGISWDQVKRENGL
jgi:hypothetical protein